MGEKWPVISTESCDFHAYTFTCCKYATWDKRLYFPSEGRRAEDFFALKNPTASAGFEPANLGTKGQHATSRPPKPLVLYCHHTHFIGYYGLASVSSGVIMHSPPCLFPIFFKIQLLSYHFERVYFETLQLSVVSPSPRKFPMQ